MPKLIEEKQVCYNFFSLKFKLCAPFFNRKKNSFFFWFALYRHLPFIKNQYIFERLILKFVLYLEKTMKMMDIVLTNLQNYELNNNTIKTNRSVVLLYKSNSVYTKLFSLYKGKWKIAKMHH